MPFDTDTLYVGLLIAANIATAGVMYLIGSAFITALLCALALGMLLSVAPTPPSVPRLGSQIVFPANRF
jgi:hypothetical protein